MTTQKKISSVRYWRHRIPMPGGIVTPGSEDTPAKLATFQLPDDLSGQSVLDVGCSDGFYSFECERRGAARVLAIDDFSSVYIDRPVGFHVAREILGSRVEFEQTDLFALDPSRVGQFDLVLFLGVLYHMRHPLLALDRLAALCRRQLIVETEIVEAPKVTGDSGSQCWMAFYPGSEINRDPTTWWVPTVACAETMLASCGFCGVRTVAIADRRAVIHAFAPALTAAPQDLLDEYGEAQLARACDRALGRSVATRDLLAVLRTLSVPEYGRLKQTLAEARAKDWHQGERWK